MPSWKNETAVPWTYYGSLFFSPIIRSDDYERVYVIDRGTTFYRYNLTAGNWAQLASPTYVTATESSGFGIIDRNLYLSPDGTKLACVSDATNNHRGGKRIEIYTIATDTWAASSQIQDMDDQLGISKTQCVAGLAWADEDTIWCWVSEATTGVKDYIRCVKYTVSTDIFTAGASLLNGTLTYGSPTNAAINAAGTIVYGSVIGATSREWYKYTIATDSYTSGGTLTAGRAFGYASDRDKLWYFDTTTYQQGYLATADDSENDDQFIENTERTAGYGGYFGVRDNLTIIIALATNTTPWIMSYTSVAEEEAGELPARSLLRHRIAMALGDMLVPIGSRPTSVANTALIDTAHLKHANNDALNGAEVYIYASTASAQGQSRWVEDYIASSSLVSVAAWTTTPGTDDNYEMHKRFRVKEYDEAIDAAHDVVRLQHLLPKVDESIILNNMVSNGLMATWASSTELTNWSGAARTGVASSALTIVREGNVIYSRYYSAKLTTPADTSQTSAFYDVISDFSKYAGRTIEVRAWVHCLTANRIRAFIQEGTGTPKYSSYHDGNGWNDSDDLYASTTLSENLSALTIGIAIAAGSQIDAYLGRLEAIAGRKIYEYDIPSGFVAIDKVEVEDSIHNVYNPISSNKDWEIIRDATKRLHIFNPIAKRGISIQGHGVRICGQRKAAKPAADTDSVELNEKFVIAYACWYLLQRNLQPNEVGILNEWKRKAEELRHQLTVSMQGKLVEVVG